LGTTWVNGFFGVGKGEEGGDGEGVPEDEGFGIGVRVVREDMEAGDSLELGVT